MFRPVKFFTMTARTRSVIPPPVQGTASRRRHSVKSFDCDADDCPHTPCGPPSISRGFSCSREARGCCCRCALRSIRRRPGLSFSSKHGNTKQRENCFAQRAPHASLRAAHRTLSSGVALRPDAAAQLFLSRSNSVSWCRERSARKPQLEARFRANSAAPGFVSCLHMFSFFVRKNEKPRLCQSRF